MSATVARKLPMPAMATQSATRSTSRERDRCRRRYRLRTSSVSSPEGCTDKRRRVSVTDPGSLQRDGCRNGRRPFDAPACGFPESQACPKPLRLSDDDRDVRELDLASRLGRLVGHELLDSLQHGFLHRQDLCIDVPPELRLLQGCGGKIGLTLHAQRVVATARCGNDVGAVQGGIGRGHRSLILPPA
jgi:hypothetical protein